jgi:hypothetical protein
MADRVKKKVAKEPVESVEIQMILDRLAYLELQNSMLIRCVSELQKMFKRASRAEEISTLENPGN